MRIQEDDSYEELGTHYQYELVRLLDRATKKAGMTATQRRQIAEEFLFDMAMVHDQHGVDVEGTRRMPVLAFVDGDVLHTPNEEFELHDYVYGNVGEYYESNGTE